MNRARKWLGGAAALYLLGLAGWLAWPAPVPDLAAAGGAAGTGLAALYAALGSGRRPESAGGGLWRAAGLGLAAGAAAPALGAALMVLRTALHARPEFAETALLGLLARAPIWAFAGLLAGAGLTLLGLAAQRWGSERG